MVALVIGQQREIVSAATARLGTRHNLIQIKEVQPQLAFHAADDDIHLASG
jgi:hypothetical protein